MPQESLLPDTKAIKKATVEIGRYRKGFLVRYKNGAGYVTQREFKACEGDDANSFFWKQVEKLRSEL